jgi:ParB family chromosome partitioning protein
MPNSLELNVSPALLHTFANHPFHVRKDMEMNELVDSIRESGVIVPLIVRSRPEGGYEIISGHRRCEACRELGIEKVPVRVQELTDDEATILMVNSNIQREHVLPSEKAFAYKMKVEAIKHQGRTTSSQVGMKSQTLDWVGKELNESRNQVHRYIRLTYLISPILQMVDESRMAFNPAVEISYMTPEHQRWLQAEMELCEAMPSLVQSRRLKEMSQSGTLTEHYLHTLLTEQKPNQRQKFFLNQSDVQRFFPPGYTPEQMQNTIFSLLKTWGHAHEHTQSQQELER